LLSRQASISQSRPTARSAIAVGVAVALPVFWTVTAGTRYLSAVAGPRPPRIDEYSNLIPLAEQIQQHVDPDERLYIFPDDEATANLYYLLRVPPPQPWIFTYPWYMIGRVRKEILDHLKREEPEWIVYMAGRWEIERHAPIVIDHIREHYEPYAPLQWAQGEAWLLRRPP
jgi:hypothetical protein